MSKTQKVEEKKQASQNKVAQIFQPNLDIVEHENGFHLYMDMPGVSKEDLSIKLEKDSLSIEGKVKGNGESSSDSIYQEYKVGNYARTLKLSPDIDHNEINANLEDGILTLSLLKAPETKARQISVN